MKKEFFGNIEYNKAKRRSGIALCFLLIICLLGTSSIFFAKRELVFGFIFLVPLIIPLLVFPSIIKNYPTNGKAIFTLDDNKIILSDKTILVKDVLEVLITISLPADKMESKNKEKLEILRKSKPEEIFLGDFDFVVLDNKNQRTTIYSTIENPIEALTDLINAGLKRYKLRYTIKKNSVLNEYDLKNELANKKQKEFQQTSKKQKNKQLL